MSNRRRVIVTGMFIILLTFTIGCGGKEVIPDEERVTGTVNFTEVETNEGKDFNPDEYKDKNVIITFVNSNCPYCDDQALHFKTLQESNDFELFYIPTNETDIQTIDKLDSIGVKDYDILIDRGQGLKKRLNVTSVPTSIVKRAGEDKFEAVVGVIEEERTKEDSKIYKDYIK